MLVVLQESDSSSQAGLCFVAHLCHVLSCIQGEGLLELQCCTEGLGSESAHPFASPQVSASLGQGSGSRESKHFSRSGLMRQSQAAPVLPFSCRSLAVDLQGLRSQSAGRLHVQSASAADWQGGADGADGCSASSQRAASRRDAEFRTLRRRCPCFAG